MGMADATSSLFQVLKFDPKNPTWADRDRFAFVRYLDQCWRRQLPDRILIKSRSRRDPNCILLLRSSRGSYKIPALK